MAGNLPTSFFLRRQLPAAEFTLNRIFDFIRRNNLIPPAFRTSALAGQYAGNDKLKKRVHKNHLAISQVFYRVLWLFPENGVSLKNTRVIQAECFFPLTIVSVCKSKTVITDKTHVSATCAAVERPRRRICILRFV